VTPTGYGGLALVGVVASWINVVAGGGSFLTLPLLIFLGLPPTLANGTNRVGILAQNVSAVLGFRKHGVLDQYWGLRAALPASLGALIGTWIALSVGDDSMRRLLATLMLVAALGTLFGTQLPHPSSEARPRQFLFMLSFFGIGVYGGFIQAGAGFLILAVTTLAGFDLVRGNAIKVLCVLVFTPLALALFASQGQVDWKAGLALGVGGAVGGQFGVRFTIRRGQQTVQRVVQVAIAICAVWLWFG
jgi:hypothetical protein